MTKYSSSVIKLIHETVIRILETFSELQRYIAHTLMIPYFTFIQELRHEADKENDISSISSGHNH